MRWLNNWLICSASLGQKGREDQRALQVLRARKGLEVRRVIRVCLEPRAIEVIPVRWVRPDRKVRKVIPVSRDLRAPRARKGIEAPQDRRVRRATLEPHPDPPFRPDTALRRAGDAARRSPSRDYHCLWFLIWRSIVGEHRAGGASPHVPAPDGWRWQGGEGPAQMRSRRRREPLLWPDHSGQNDRCKLVRPECRVVRERSRPAHCWMNRSFSHRCRQSRHRLVVRVHRAARRVRGGMPMASAS